MHSLNFIALFIVMILPHALLHAKPKLVKQQGCQFIIEGASGLQPGKVLKMPAQGSQHQVRVKKVSGSKALLEFVDQSNCPSLRGGNAESTSSSSNRGGERIEQSDSKKKGENYFRIAWSGAFSIPLTENNGFGYGFFGELGGRFITANDWMWEVNGLGGLKVLAFSSINSKKEKQITTLSAYPIGLSARFGKLFSFFEFGLMAAATYGLAPDMSILKNKNVTNLNSGVSWFELTGGLPIGFYVFNRHIGWTFIPMISYSFLSFSLGTVSASKGVAEYGIISYFVIAI